MVGVGRADDAAGGAGAAFGASADREGGARRHTSLSVVVRELIAAGLEADEKLAAKTRRAEA